MNAPRRSPGLLSFLSPLSPLPLLSLVSLCVPLGVLGAACAEPTLRAKTPVTPAASATEVAQASPSSASSASAPLVGVAPQAPPAFEAEFREILDQLIAADTSHGNETAALHPIADRFEKVGLHAEILESAPGRGNLVVRLKGDGTKKPLLLLAHIDVVPVEGQPWTVPAFKPTEKDGFLWGRGVGDDKGMAAAIVAIGLELARSHTPLSRDVIIALTAGEETGGSAGARWLVKNHKDLIDAEIALNEGGGLTLTDDLQKIRAATFGAAEKTFQTFRLVAHGKGGHSSVPSTGDNPVTRLSRALVRIGDHKFPAHVLPWVKESLALRAAAEKPPLSDALTHAAASAPKVLPADEKVLSADAFANALIRTTCVATMLQGSPQDNVLPTTAEASVNCRILPDETRDTTQAALVRAMDDAMIDVARLEDIGDAPPSPIDGEVPAAIKKLVQATWPGTPVIAGMGTGASDSRHLRAVGITAYGFGSPPSSLQESRAGHGAHGPDERRPSAWLGPNARLLRDLTRVLAAPAK
jgi:acetylornithine deacetylase/succinyl-diaminopimelate desuccinylase-like protein